MYGGEESESPLEDGRDNHSMEPLSWTFRLVHHRGALPVSRWRSFDTINDRTFVTSNSFFLSRSVPNMLGVADLQGCTK
jgi:hypothetical protein